MTSIATLKRQAFDLPKHWVQDWLLFVLDKPASFLISHDDYVLDDAQKNTFFEGITKMQQGTPLAYLTHTAYFWSLSLSVNEHTLIPRPDSEIVVETTLALSHQLDSPCLEILDLGTGSGCLALALKHELSTRPNHITAVDKSADALMVAKHNGQTLGLEITWQQSDWFDALSQKFDVIITNPPYIAHDDPHLDKLTAEPITALVADDDGLADIKHIIAHAPRYLNHGGFLMIEHGYNQGSQVRQLLIHQGFDKVQSVRDYGGNERASFGFWYSV